MKRLLPILGLAGLVLLSLPATAGEKPVTYYVQLIRCTDRDQRPDPGSRKIGPKLAGKFQCVLRCKSYWEISQQKVDVPPHQSVRAHLSNERDVEIDLTKPGKRRVTTYHKGRLIDRTVEPLGEDMTLIGGDRDQSSHWFIVVRRDKPGH